MPSAETAAMDLDRAGEGAVERFRRKMTNPLLWRLYMLLKLPLGLAAGMRLKTVGRERCETVIRYGWRNTNPFRSMYFAAQSMAAELSTGALGLLAVEVEPKAAAAGASAGRASAGRASAGRAKPSVAMLITGMEVTFGKKATGLVTFTCEDGAAIFGAVRETLATGEPAVARAETVGRMEDGAEVSRFVFTWSFKRRS